MKFNESQSMAIRHKDGPMLVIAGPGSGKTSTLCHRVHNLEFTYQIPEKKILVLTFTKNAAEHMQNEYLKLKGDNEYTDVTFCTIHSLCYKIIFEHNREKLNIISESDKVKIIKRLLAESFNDNDIDVSAATDVGDLISYTMSNKSKVFEGEKFENENMTSYFGDRDTFIKFFNKYSDYKKKHNIFDFDDLIFVANELMDNNPKIKRIWQDRFSYILVDEFQDTNDHEFDIITKLSFKHKNVFAVGDDDQSIYGFRGSNPGIMKRFLKEYEGDDCKTVYLTVNYRSTSEITSISDRLIRHNLFRMDKKMKNESLKRGEVVLKKYSDKNKQYTAILEDIKRRISSEEKKEEIAVLFRTNLMKNDFIKRTKIFGNLCENEKHFVGTKYIEEIISLFKIVSGVFEIGDVVNSMNILDGGLTSFYLPKDINRIEEWPEIVKRCDDLTELKGVNEYLDLIKALRKVSPAVGLKIILNNEGYKRRIRKEYNSYDEYRRNYSQILSRLNKIAHEKFTYSDTIMELKIANKSKNDVAYCGINILTLHESKGLEFDTVYIPDLNMGILPIKKATGKDGVEEERRLLYVGLTRARKNLILSFPLHDSRKELKASGFVRELMND